MFIIVEGMDNTGKSTLAFRLANDLKAVLVNNRDKPRSYEDAERWTVAMTKLITHTVVFDRWCGISEPIYGPVLKRDNILSPQDVKDLCYAIKNKVSTVVIYCNPPLDVVQGSITEREQMEGVVDNTEELYNAYTRQIALTRQWLPVLEWDYTKDGYDQLLEKIRNEVYTD